MAIADASATDRGQSIPSTLFPALQAWLQARRTVRAQRLALQTLLRMPEHRLEDLGIGRYQLIGITEIHRK